MIAPAVGTLPGFMQRVKLEKVDVEQVVGEGVAA